MLSHIAEFSTFYKVFHCMYILLWDSAMLLYEDLIHFSFDHCILFHLSQVLYHTIRLLRTQLLSPTPITKNNHAVFPLYVSLYTIVLGVGFLNHKVYTLSITKSCQTAIQNDHTRLCPTWFVRGFLFTQSFASRWYIQSLNFASMYSIKWYLLIVLTFLNYKWD